jgi:hypothetical protein
MITSSPLLLSVVLVVVLCVVVQVFSTPHWLYFESHDVEHCNSTIAAIQGVRLGQCQTDKYFLSLWDASDNITNSFEVLETNFVLEFFKYTSSNCSMTSLFNTSAIPISAVNVSRTSVNGHWEVNDCAPHPFTPHWSMALRINHRPSIPLILTGYYHSST